MDDQGHGDERGPRPPTVDDLTTTCSLLNEAGARYVVIGGMAIISAGMDRTTGDIDLLVDTAPENLGKVLSALSKLPDGAARGLLRFLRYVSR